MNGAKAAVVPARAGDLGTASRSVLTALAGKAPSPPLRWLRRFFLLAMLAWLGWRLQRIGLDEIWARRPASIAFYLLLVAAYLVLPVADTLIYSRLWKIGFWRSLPVCLRKRVYNAAFIGYSGELVLLGWAWRRVGLDERTLAHAIKDTNILSAAVSTFFSAALLLYVLAHLPWAAAQVSHWNWWVAGTFAPALVIPVAFFYRDRFMLFGIGTMLAVSGVHLCRFLLTQLLQVGLWAIQLPAAPLNALATLLAVQLLVGRAPLLPNRDILFVGIGMGLAGPLALPQASVASLLVTVSLFQQLMHFAVFAGTSFPLRRT